ncbi:MAG TPA: right-handed parallel beta-helix repeat-containing protein, partial [Chitinophagaceae bacterium]|nr:right-handed parallel beta-helix repeat-containing protein [Chitinophagaceae bacterium]
MKRLHRCLLVLLLLVCITGNAMDIYVTSFGNDSNAGTKDNPLATINAALRKARELRRLNDPSVAGGIHIIISGTFTLDEPIFIRPEDSGTADSPTIIEAASNGKAAINGGIQFRNWELAPSNTPGLSAKAKGKVWVTDVPMTGGGPTEFRQFWSNYHKATRARERNGDSMNRIIRWDKTKAACWIPTPKGISPNTIEGMEMLIHQWWEIAILRVQRMEVHGDSSLLYFHEPESRVQNEHPWPAPWMSKETGNSAFYLSNHISFLDEPGEWWLDIAGKKLYYWPAKGEEHRFPSAYTGLQYAPVLETLVKMEGTADRPVSYVFFKNILFQYTGWLRPSKQGHVPHQAGMYMTDAYKLKVPGTADKKTLENQAWIGRPTAAIQVRYAHHTGFESCNFTRLASTALDYEKGTQDNKIIGNSFWDIGGSAILAGVFSDESTETHIPYNPSDEKEFCRGIIIRNNLITNVANEDWGCVGIGAGYVRDMIIENNELWNLPYTGISVGWGWTPTANVMKNNRISKNKIHHYGRMMYDVAAIYTLSAQPGT